MATSTIHQSTMMGSFKVTTLTKGYTCSGNSAVTVEATGSESGWTPIAVVGGRLGYTNMYAYAINPTFTKGSAAVRVLMRNSSSTASGDRTLQIRVLWVR